MAADLFAEPRILSPGAMLLPGLADDGLLPQLYRVAAAAPFRHMVTPGGFTMSVAMTNCGSLGWITDRRGYRYSATDPLSDAPWPAMPEQFRALAERAAKLAGYPAFQPDGCLINRYQPGARMSLHQDRNEDDFAAPIVSVSLGLAAVFLWGGAERRDRPQRIELVHGDVLVWGGVSRLHYHGVAPLAEGSHPALGRVRINLTFRKVR